MRHIFTKNDPPDNILQQLALLSRLPVEEVNEYFIQSREKAQKTVRDNIGRENLVKSSFVQT